MRSLVLLCIGLSVLVTTTGVARTLTAQKGGEDGQAEWWDFGGGTVSRTESILSLHRLWVD